MNSLFKAHLNINSISNRFDKLKLLVRDKVGILVAMKTKLDSTFHNSQFLIEDYSEPYRFDKSKHGCGIPFCVREDILSEILTSHKLPHDIEEFFVHINLRNLVAI